MAAAAQVVEGMGADIVDVNMGCPVPKIARHNAGCSLMREPEHAAAVIGAMTKAVKIPVTVKMRAGWNDGSRNAPDLARMVQDAGAAAVAIHGRTAEQSYSGSADWDLVTQVAGSLAIPVFGSGDCVEPGQIVDKMRRMGQQDGRGVAGVLVGRGVLRNPWILAQAQDIANGLPPRLVTPEQRGRFLLDYIELLRHERIHEPTGFRHTAPGASEGPVPPVHPAVRSHDRWVINKLRALMSWYSKGLDGGAHLRVRINSAESVTAVQDIIEEFFSSEPEVLCPAG
jgi:tRNA-dihydrouridine synthase B